MSLSIVRIEKLRMSRLVKRCIGTALPQKLQNISGKYTVEKDHLKNQDENSMLL